MTSGRKFLEQQASHVPTSESREFGNDSLTLGLVPSPGLPEDIANDIRDDLARELGEAIDSEVRWVVRVVSDPITGSNVETPDLLEELGNLAHLDAWDYTIALTDLPVRRNGKIVLADASTDQRAGWISVPAMGVLGLRRKVRRIIVHLVEDLYAESNEDTNQVDNHLRSDGVARGDTSDAAETIDTRYISRSIFATARLLTGMVYANEPWTIFPSFKTTAVTAVATGSYGLIFSSMWELGEHASIIRLIVLSIVAMSLLSAWIIVSHDLWQPHYGTSSRFLTSLYNATTVLTIGTGVLFASAMIYLVLLFESVIFMPPSLLTSRLEMPVDALNYVTATWVTTSVATLAGALGAGLEDTERVREATFSWRMQRRLEEYEAARDENKDDRGEHPE